MGMEGLTMKKSLNFIAIMCILVVFAGCAQQTATQQIVKQTSDPVVIALAVLTDAQDAYIGVQQLYKPYQKAIKATSPETDKQIIDWLKEANKILDEWEDMGDIQIGKKDAFREYIRKISLELALQMGE